MFVLTYKNEDGEVVLYSVYAYETREEALKDVNERYSYFDKMYPLIPVGLLSFKNCPIEHNIIEENTQN